VNVSTYNTFTGTTAPSTYLTISNFDTFTGTTAPSTYLTISNFDTYSGNTLILIGTKQDTITGAATTITSSNLTINRALISDNDGKVSVSNTTSTELLYVSGVTSSIQTQLNLKSPIDSPTFTGIPAAPTAAINTSTTQIATTDYVVGQASATNPLMNGTVSIGTSLRYSREDHVHPSDTNRLSISGGTLTGSLQISNNLTVSGISNLTTLTVGTGLAKYIDDYSGSYDIRTLVDKNYVDTLPLTYLNTISAGGTTTTSTTYTLQTGMQITGVTAGTYLVGYGNYFNHGNSNGQIYTTIYVGGTAQTGSEMRWTRGNQNIFITHNYSNFVITLATTQTVEIRWRTSTGTATSTNRYLTLLKTSSLI
jgi:hypothetical protein